MARMAKQMKDLRDLLEAMAENTRSVSKGFEEDGDKEFADKLFHEYMGMNSVIMMIDNPDLFRSHWKTFMEDK